MKYDELVGVAGDLPWFDLALVIQAFDGRREVIRSQVSRLVRQGRIIRLRRGMYTLPERYRRAKLVPAALAGALYRPSYLSGAWALGFYDLIPERVVRLTSVTTRVPRCFENPYGVFEYRHIKWELFSGCRPTEYGGQEIMVAEPEKALLDYWYLSRGEWTEERISEMRFQNTGQVSAKKLLSGAGRFGSRRLVRAAECWLKALAGNEEGTVSL